MKAQRLPLAISVMALCVALVGSPGAAVSAVKKVVFADNAGSVNGLKASKKPRPGRLVALNENKKFPSSVLPAGQAGARGPRGATGPQGPPGAASVADGSVTASKLAPDSVDGSKIADGSITGSDLGSEQMSGLSIMDGSVTPSELSTGAQPHWVQVASSGVILDQSDGSFSVSHPNTGTYVVTNSVVDIGDCAASVTRNSVSPGIIETADGPANTQTVYVDNVDGFAEDRGFYLVAFCNRQP